jgi:peptidoglycan hydrolase-like protein with peptidoglycan-binding domain
MKVQTSIRFRAGAAIFALCFTAYAQHQRLALRPGSVSLAPQGKAIQEAFCLDHHLYAAADMAAYKNILTPDANAVVRFSSGRAVSLGEAVARGLIRVEGGSGNGGRQYATGIGIQFSNLTSEAATIEVRDPVAFGEHPGGLEVSLDRLRRAGESKDHQAKLWAEGRTVRYLRMLDYLDDAGYTDTKLKAAVSRYQAQKRLGATSVLDESTARALEGDIESATKQLESVGFPVDGDGESSDLSQAINDYQRHLGMMTNGRLGPQTRAQLRRDSAALADIQAALKSANPSGYLTGRATTNVVATQKDSLFAYALTKGANTGAEFWTILGGKVLDRRRGTAALTSWDARSAGLAGEYTTDDTIVLHFGSYTRKDGGHVTIGDAAVPFNPEGQSFRAFFDQPDVKKAFASFASENQGKPRLLVFRDGSFRQGIAEHGGNGSLFESAGRLRVDPQEIVAAAQQALGGRYQVGLANDLAAGAKNAANLPKLRSGAQLKVMVDSSERGDFKVIDNVATELGDAHIEIVEADQQPSGVPRVFLFAEHNSAGYRARVLGQARSGRFRGGVIATAVCGLGGEAEFNSELIRVSGARAVIYYPMEIEAPAIEKVMINLAGRLQQNGAGDGDFLRIWNESVTAAWGEANSLEMRNSIEKLRNALMQFSKLERATEAVDAE